MTILNESRGLTMGQRLIHNQGEARTGDKGPNMLTAQPLLIFRLFRNIDFFIYFNKNLKNIFWPPAKIN